MHDSISRQQPRYHFRIFMNGEQKNESAALAFDDPEEAWHEGAMTSCELIRSMYGRVDPETDWRLDVSDASNNVIYRFSFKAEKL